MNVEKTNNCYLFNIQKPSSGVVIMKSSDEPNYKSV